MGYFPDLSKRNATHFNNPKEIKYAGRGDGLCKKCQKNNLDGSIAIAYETEL
jgi:hypothetical protein